MKTFSFFRIAATALVLSITATVSSPAQWFGGGGTRGSGKILSDTRPVTEFSKINIVGTGDVLFKKGNKREVVIEADDNIWESVLTEVSADGELKLGMKSGSYNNIHLKFIITNPTLEGVKISGSGSADIEGLIDAKRFVSVVSGSGSIRYKGGKVEQHDLTISGSGSINASKLQANEAAVQIYGSGDASIYAAKTLKTQMTGSGSLDVESSAEGQYFTSNSSGSGSIRFRGGKAEKLDVTIKGSGNVQAERLQAENVSVQISGSGDATVYANKSLDAQIFASGDVYYSGNATSVSKTIRGSGSVSKR
ncbi:MAG: DUF2807 domain-containing protein [Candidatus Kapabacteria bacterium]|jgi:hypothetical protein|nr:DUF2807 domain-containing protein [Candidatus Kapabacteria bacterium]